MRPDRHSSKFFFAVAALGLPILIAGSAIAQSSDTDLRSIGNRLDRIEREISDIQRQSYGGGGTGAPTPIGSGANAADLETRLTQLEDQVRMLTGRLEEASHRAEQATKELQTFKADVELRFQDLQDGGAASVGAATSGGEDKTTPASESTLGAQPSGQASGAGEAASAQSVLPSGTPQTQYDFAIDLMKRGQYPQARTAFLEFLQLHPKHELAGNAQYWLGETYYAENNYKQAGDAFLNGYTTYASSSKAPDSLLKLGMSLSALGNTDAACTVWGELGSRFPQASPSIVARAKLERQKAGC
ncbi:Tol-Pal system YbgF [Parvibaculum lavamentivorans DS-1]|uniref:Cell division coordinator CpoB n=1 Tax=Parvibaculum lavamentivorans (strain DS-1 / DSM 13023 / NCIMB 13966) TaxID=402881 RepID=A7HV05_PARL1|nr:tol-pal system protein YbgF [Parvibaculum lavamentivorans]ABS63738.1 Tol-Pal system YbgF [Parvibaculum lavamentivorans DS-1]